MSDEAKHYNSSSLNATFERGERWKLNAVGRVRLIKPRGGRGDVAWGLLHQWFENVEALKLSPCAELGCCRIAPRACLTTSERREERENVTAGSYGLGIQVSFHVHSCTAVEKIDLTALVVV